MSPVNDPFRPTSTEGIDFDKLLMLIKKNIWIILFILIVTNLVAYLTIRWTKDVYESQSELKLEVKQDATALGITQLVEDQNRNIVAGEIEQIKSKLFFSRLLDSLDLWVSYYSIGNVLEFEMYRSSPFKVSYTVNDRRYYDQPIYFDFVEGGRYQIRVGENEKPKEAALGETISLEGAAIRVDLAPGAEPDFKNKFFFVINSRERLLGFIDRNLKVEPINFDASTIRISFRDYNPLKVYTIINTIDSVYLTYSNEQKNRANKQKILWLNNELAQVEGKMENFENYFENFTLKNKSSNVDADLKKTIVMINRLDSQRFDLNKRINDLNELMTDLSEGRPIASLLPRAYLPAFMNAKFEDYQKIAQDQNRLTLSY
ncbi:MAG: hypothetical protein K2U26_08005, partial [Cyclobacteriaceae bacterium]|nr:hypothetical protein [Cyclobacteriaceae bacterium]